MMQPVSASGQGRRSPAVVFVDRSCRDAADTTGIVSHKDSESLLAAQQRFIVGGLNARARLYARLRDGDSQAAE